MLSNSLVWETLSAEWNAEGGFDPNDLKTRIQLQLCLQGQNDIIATFVPYKGLKTCIQTANICIHFTHKVMSFLDKRSNCASNGVTVPPSYPHKGDDCKWSQQKCVLSGLCSIDPDSVTSRCVTLIMDAGNHRASVWNCVYVYEK